MSPPKIRIGEDFRKAIDEYKLLRRAQTAELRELRRSNFQAMKQMHAQHRQALKDFTIKIGRQQARRIRQAQKEFKSVFDWRQIGRRPDPASLAQKGYFAADCHMHSNYSDGIMNVEEIITRAKELRLNISVTDHDEIKGSLKALEIGAKRGVNVLPGIEVTSREAKHFLFYFLDSNEMKRFYAKEIRGKEYRPTSELLDAKPDYSTIMVWAHPKGIYPWQSHTPDFNTQALDGMEAYNSWGLSKNIREIYAWSKKEKRFSIGSSDAHMIREIGNVITYAKAKTFSGFFNRLQRREARIAGKDANYVLNSAMYALKYVFVRKSPTV